MPPKRKGSLSILKDASGRKYYRGRVRLADGSREWVDPNTDKPMSEAKAREWIAAWQENDECLGITTRNYPAISAAFKPAFFVL